MSPEEKAARKAWCWKIARDNLAEARMLFRFLKKYNFDELEKEIYSDNLLRRLGMANDYRALAKSGYETIHIHPSLIW